MTRSSLPWRLNQTKTRSRKVSCGTESHQSGRESLRGEDVTEHTQMTESMEPFADSWGLTPPSGPDADHQKELDKLNGLSGAEFDKEYMSQMVTDHTKALNAFTTEAKDTKDVKFRAAVIRGKTLVAAHKNMAYDLKKKL
jgi:putative membrane protein